MSMTGLIAWHTMATDLRTSSVTIMNILSLGLPGDVVATLARKWGAMWYPARNVGDLYRLLGEVDANVILLNAADVPEPRELVVELLGLTSFTTKIVLACNEPALDRSTLGDLGIVTLANCAEVPGLSLDCLREPPASGMAG